MRRRILTISIACITMMTAVSHNAMAIELPDLGKLASDIATGVAETADNAGKAISDAADQVGEMATAAGQQIGVFASGFAANVNEVAAQWAENAGETADNVKKAFDEAGATIQVTAGDLGNATAEKAAELTATIQETAGDVMNTVNGTANMVIDQAGHVVDLAAVGADYVTTTAYNVMEIISQNGEKLMKLATDAVADIDLSDPANWEPAKEAIADAIVNAYEEGLISEEVIDADTMNVLVNIVFDSILYGYQYSNCQISLDEYTKAMSETIIREGLPTGVSYIADKLPVPFVGKLAKAVTTYLIALAYEDKPGDEITAEEEAVLEEALSEAVAK